MTSEIFENLLRPVKELNPQAPPELCTLIHRCLAYKPTRRPERVSDVLDDLNVLAKKVVRSDEDRLEAIGESPAAGG
jgi:hypothetical protein